MLHGLTMGEIARMPSARAGAGNAGWMWSAAAITPMRHLTASGRAVAQSADAACRLPLSVALSFRRDVCSLGRGTDKPFEIYGHPDMKGYGFSFTPRPTAGAKHPPLEGRLCHGADLSRMPLDEARQVGLTLRYVIEAYRNLGLGERFFTPMFEKLIGVAMSAR